MREQMARDLLAIGAVHLRPQEPFTWTSGIKSPIYCDNRLTLSYPEIRQKIAKQMAKFCQEQFPEATVIAGTATAGIPHAAWVADLLNLPMSYVRSSAKGHGKQNQIEGIIKSGDQVVIIEDLISTGKSSLQVVEAVEAVGAKVLGVVAIFTYGFSSTKHLFQQIQVPVQTITDYSTLIQVAKEDGKLTEEELCQLEKWDPFTS